MAKSFKRGCFKDKFLPAEDETEVLQTIEEGLDKARQYHIDVAEEHRTLHNHEEIEDC